MKMNVELQKNSVESHLFSRPRETARWMDDRSKAIEVIVDKSFIVDGKCAARLWSVTRPRSLV